MFLNLGCGDPPVHAPEPWVNVDSYAGCEPDVLADIMHLPYDDQSIEAVYCGHVLVAGKRGPQTDASPAS
jgi:predicted SAM-dependent methyltransferase